MDRAGHEVGAMSTPEVRASRAGRLATHGALLLVQIAFASQAVEAKVAMLPRAVGGEAIVPEAIAMMRMLGAALFFQGFARSTGALVRTTRRDQALLAGLSILGIALNQTLFLIGLRLTTPASAGLLAVTIPVFTAALAVLARVEKPSLPLALGLGCALGGVLFLTGIRNVDRGAAIVTVNCVSYAAYIVFSRGVIRRLGALTVITWIFTWGGLLFAPLGAPALVHAPEWTPRAWGFLAYIVAVPTIVAYLANAWALGRSSPTLVTIYVYLQPPLTALFAWAQLGDRLSPRLVTSAVMILVGVGIVAFRPTAASAPASASAQPAPSQPRPTSSR
jgi:drug/metabolite transporter (DMT)-like permease